MSSIGTGYDLSASQFSPDGRVFQVEYAQKAVENSGTAVGIRGKDGVVFGVEKLITSKLYEAGDNKRILNVDKHVGAAVAGLNADARHLIERAREEASSYRHSYGDPIPLRHLTERVSGYVHAHTLYSSVRPFGVSMILGSFEEDGPQMYLIEPSGVSWGYYGCAIGKAKQNAKTEIEKLKMKDMSVKDLVKEVAKIIYIVHDEVKDKSFELELSWVGDARSKFTYLGIIVSEDVSKKHDLFSATIVRFVDATNGYVLFSVSGGKHELVPPEVFIEAERYAKEALEESDDSDDEDL